MLFVSHSRNKFDASSILFNVCHSLSITICFHNYSLSITISHENKIFTYLHRSFSTEKMLLRYDTIYRKYYFFYLQELMLLIFAKIFAFKTTMYNVLLKFNVMKSVLFPRTWHL